MNKMITTLAEMPAVAGLTLKSFIGKGERSKRFSHRTGVLVACVGLILFMPMASIKGGFIEDVGKKLLTSLAENACESGIGATLNQINNADPNSGAGMLMSILGVGGNTTDEQLKDISSQITVAQNMIVGLQSDLDAFEGKVNQSLSQILLGQAVENFKNDADRLKSDYNSLRNLTAGYSNVVACCYSNGVLKTQLSPSDLNVFNTFVHSSALQTYPDNVLNDLAALSSEAMDGSVYDDAFDAMKLSVPFQHQTYAGMYNLFNYMASMRATALFLKKECQSYQWTQRTGSDTNLSLAQWMNNNVLETTASGPGVTDTANQINADVANNVILTKMATLLTNSVATNGPQRLAYLYGLISTNYPFPGGSVPAYVVINNTDGQSYLINKQAGPFSYTTIPVISYWQSGFVEMSSATNYYRIASYAQHTEDGRFQLAATNHNLSNLFIAGTEPIPYLRSNGGLTNINPNTTFIYLSSPPAITNFSPNHEPSFSNSINGTVIGIGKNVSISQSAVLIDVNNYNSTAPNYVTTNGSFISVSNVLSTYSNKLFMSIYYDTQLATGTNQYYAPAGWDSLPSLFSLDTGDVLDLTGYTGQYGPYANTTVRICGNATIIGGGPGTTAFSGLTIETYGGNLTLSNLCLISGNGVPVINNVSGPLTVVILGSNSLATTVGPAVVSASGANITFTGPGSLALTTTDANAPAVQATGDIIATGATNLTFSSQGFSSIVATRIFISNSTVTSQVIGESDNEFAAGTIALGNSVLNMSYGIINPYIISPCTWLGQTRNTSQFTVQQTSSWFFGVDFHDGIFVKLAGTTGTSEFMNINSAPNYILANYGPQTFNMSYCIASTGTSNIQGLGKLQSIQIYKQDDEKFTWELESADIAPNVRGDVASTYHIAVTDFWFNTIDTNSFSAVEENNPYGYTINRDNKTVTITGFTGAGALIIPSSIHGYLVTGIAANAFENNTTLTSITIPGSVTSIGASAFASCNSLAEVYFQGNAPILGSNAFNSASIANICYLPGTAGWTTPYADHSTALWVPFTYRTNSDNATVTITGYTGLGGAVIIPNLINGLSVTGVAANAFENNTALTSVTIPASVTSIPDQAFENCYCLTAVYFQGNAPSLGTNVFTGADLATAYYLPVPGTMGWGATYGGLPTALWEPFTSTTNSDNTATITGYTGSGGTVTIPSTINGVPVSGIGANAFTSNVFVSALQITNVLIPNTITNLGDGAFQMCSNLIGVYFQGNPPSLGANVFAGDAIATAYFLPATTGWGAMFGVLRTAPWLTVNGGTDGGDYSNLQQVTITANNPTPTNSLMAPLVQWTGATQYVANVNAANTTVNLPAQPVTLTAMFAVAPVITAQPSSLAAISGGNATFNVTAWGPVPLAYQWYFNNSSISGAMAASQTLTGVTTNNVGSYTVVVTNLYGSVTSSVATLMVLLPPSITTQPASQVAAVGGAVNLSASTAGTAPFAYQWFKNGGMVSGATNSALTLANAGVTNSGVYYVVVTSAYGLSISLPASVAVGAPQLLAWGNNVYGQLGDGTTTGRNLPEPVASNVVAAVAGGDQSLYLKSDGTLWAVGFNGDGELGDGTRVTRDSAVSVASDVVAVAAGAWHSLYLKSDGTLWVVGQNNYGQLGDGTTTSRSNAVSVASNVVAAAAGAGHSLYLKSDGTLWAMGYNNFGQLGDGTMTSQSLAESVASNVVAVAAGADHSLYLKSDGTLWAMGWNGEGELGDGTTISRSHAVAVGVGSNVAAVAAGDYHSLFAKADGTLWAMGRNDAGQLGDGTTTSRSNAVSVASNVVAVAAGGLHSLYLKSDGALWAMGRNDSGELGDGTATPWNGQVQVSGMALASVVSGRGAQHTLAVGVPLPPVITSQPASQKVLAGSNVTFTVAASGFVPLVCQWYFNGNPRGEGTNFSLAGVSPFNSGNYTVVVSNAGGSVTSSVAVLMVLALPTITTAPTNQTVAVGGTVNLSVAPDGPAPFGYQWLKDGRMLLGATNSALTLAGAGVTDSGVYYVVVTNAYGLSISQPATVTVGDPQLLVWGYNQYGQLGDGTTTTRTSPVAVVGGSNVVAVAGGRYHTLYLKSDGTLWAMGYNQFGQLGDGTTTDQHSPESVASNVVAVAAGDRHSLYLTGDGTLWAMGQNGYGQLGDGTTNSQDLPEPVASNVVAVAGGGYHTLYLKSDGTLWAMGFNQFGQLGDGTTTDQHSPESVASNVVAVAAGDRHSLFVTSDGKLRAMGYNGAGQLGNGTTTDQHSPDSVASQVVAVAAGYDDSLFVKSDGTLWAMGYNAYGQSGDGTTTDALLPESVGSNVVAVAAGATHSLYLTSDGTLWAMGRNNYGQLGDGTTTERNSPVAVPGMSLANVTSGCDAQHTLAVGVPLPPLITSQPTNQTALAGSHVIFRVTANGFSPLAYHWCFNGTNLNGARQSNYNLNGMTTNNAGNYTVVVSNPGGSVTSSVVSLTVITLPPGYNQISSHLLSAGDMQLSFVGNAGGNYALDRSFSLSPADWVPQATNAADAGGALVFTNTPDPTTNNFWRVRFVP